MGLAERVEVYVAALDGDRSAVMRLLMPLRSPEPGWTDWRVIARVSATEAWLAVVLFSEGSRDPDPLPEPLMRRVRGQRQLADAFAGRWPEPRGPVQ